MKEQEQEEIIRHGRRPLEEDQPIGKRARTQSYIVGEARALLVERMRKHFGHSSKSVTIRQLIDAAAIELGFAVVKEENEVGVEPVVLPKTQALRSQALSVQ